jgi:hypothetical protein
LQVFFCVVAYGLFHGLIFLPVILSLVGPSTLYRLPNDKCQQHANGHNHANGSLPTCETTKEFLRGDSDSDDDDGVGDGEGIKRNGARDDEVVRYRPVDDDVDNVTFLTNHNV